MISVCMATFNGEKFLREQVDSILIQLEKDDEIVISDDGSTDGTLEILKEYSQIDDRVIVIEGPKKGLVANFEHALKNSRGELIFLADQDDVWLPEKVSVITEFFSNHCEIDVVVADLIVVNDYLEPIISSYFEYRQVHHGFFKNIIRNSYIGAGMAFRSCIKSKVLPFPSTIPMHDMWIALLSEWENKTAFVNEPLTLYRRHGGNSSEIATDASLFQQFKWRCFLMTELTKRIITEK